MPWRFAPVSESPRSSEPAEAQERPKSKRDQRPTLGSLVATRRDELGLTQEDLARKLKTSPATVAQIEKDEEVSTETLKRLTEVLPPEKGKEELQRAIERELLRRGLVVAPTTASPVRRDRAPTSRRSLRGRWLWGGLAVAVLAALGLIVAAPFSGGDDDPAPPEAELVSAPPAPVAVEPQKNAQKAKARKAKARRAKARRAKLAAAQSAPAASDDESSSSDTTTTDNSSSSDDTSSEPVSTPAPAPAPAPSPSSNRPRPGIQHGINPGG